MIFHRVTLNNLFSYQGEQVFEFGTSGAGRIILVMGRNGFGKTSLLNAIKLLFLGADDRNQRQVGFPPSGLSRSHYLSGNGASWAGILNLQAKAAGEKRCSVKIEMGPVSGVTFVAERSWDFDSDPVKEILEVIDEGQPLADQAAEGRLDEFLPRELVPFFFFDGEEIQFLAEASDVRRAEAMERLLSLSFVNGVEGELEALTKSWRREMLPEEVQADIADQEGKLDANQKHQAALLRKEQELEAQQTEYEEEAADLRHKMDVLRQNSVFGNAQDLDGAIADLEEALQREQNELAYALAKDAPLLANPGLVRGALDPLRLVIEQKARSNESVIDTLFRVLPERVFVEPPQPKLPLSEEQRRFFENKMKRILDSFGVQDEQPTSLFDSLDLPRARALLERFQNLAASIKILREEKARALREISRKKKLLEDKKAERRELEFGNADAAAQFREIEEQYDECQQQIGRIASDLEKLRDSICERIAEKEKIEKDVKALERQASEAQKASDRLSTAIALRDAFRLYRRRRREAKRKQIEDSLNEHFKKLMTGHSLIKKIEVSEDFHLRFLGDEGQVFGHSTISHGMRQLAVTALLWALKDVSGKSLPVMVDTPLARIDRGNQENLLTNYYPNAADQVIVLATDSEVDERKYALMRDDVGRVIELRNSSGQSTAPREISLSSVKSLWEDVHVG